MLILKMGQDEAANDDGILVCNDKMSDDNGKVSIYKFHSGIYIFDCYYIILLGGLIGFHNSEICIRSHE